MKLLLVPIIALLAGCGSLLVPPPAAPPVQTPTLVFNGSCDDACTFTAEYTDPRDRVQVVQPTNVWDFGLGSLGMVRDTVLGAAPWAATGIIAYEYGKRMVGHGATDNSVVTNTDNRVDYSGNTGRLFSDDDYTHDPLVVLQPPPVIVEPQPPVIVEQPDPVIINGGAP